MRSSFNRSNNSPVVLFSQYGHTTVNRIFQRRLRGQKPPNATQHVLFFKKSQSFRLQKGRKTSCRWGIEQPTVNRRVPRTNRKRGGKQKF